MDIRYYIQWHGMAWHEGFYSPASHILVVAQFQVENICDSKSDNLRTNSLRK